MSLWSLPLPARSRNSRKEIKQPARKLFSCRAVHSLRARCFRFVHRQRLQLIHYPRASAPADSSDARAVAADHDFPTGCPTRGKLFSCSSFSKTGHPRGRSFACGLAVLISAASPIHRSCDNELPGLTHHCSPDPGHRIVPNAPKRPVERQEELLALSASTCSRLQSIR